LGFGHEMDSATGNGIATPDLDSMHGEWPQDFA
jgi:hypothetical protein